MRICPILAFSIAIGSTWAQTSVSLYVKETAGIRRMGFPVNARVPFPKGALVNASDARLMSADAEVPAQFSAESQWPDNSTQWLDVDFNASLAPSELHTYRVEYGSGVKPASTPRGLTVTQDAGSIQIGQVKFSKLAAPLLVSAKHRGEDIAMGVNGITVVDSAGREHELTNSKPPKVEIVKLGPLYVVLRYSGLMPIDTSYNPPYTITVEMPNSKSWVKVTAVVDDPQKRLRELAYHSPLAFGAFPWVWDFGTDRWTYGSFKTSVEGVSLTQTFKPGAATQWRVVMNPKGQEQVVETGTLEPTLEKMKRIGWAHIQDAHEVVALGLETPEKVAGTSDITILANGQTHFSFTPATPVTEHRITVYQHFVAAPVQIGAVTTPSSMLAPLNSYCDPKQYTLSGLKQR
jgi:hypothetical protein